MPAITSDLPALAQSIKDWGRELGFQQVGISGLDLAEHEQHLERWLEAGYHGEMDYMGAHGSKRSHPEELVPGTLRVVSLRMDYLAGDTQMAQSTRPTGKSLRLALCLGPRLPQADPQTRATTGGQDSGGDWSVWLSRIRRQRARAGKSHRGDRPALDGSAKTPWS
jgi:hypothetical protein